MPASDRPAVIMIGGPSATGKSTLAESIARRIDTRCLDLDSFYIAFRRVVPREVAPPGLHKEEESFWARPPDELVQVYMQVQDFMCHAFETVVAQHLRRRQSVVMEGTWLRPEFAVQPLFDGAEASGCVNAVFLFETDERELERRRLERADPWARTFADDVMRNIAAMRYLLGLEMKHRAETLGLPVLECRPFATLEGRALAALGLETADTQA